MLYKIGDVCNADADYIVHQCNCITIRPKGLSLQLEKAYPGSTPYTYRTPTYYRSNLSIFNTRNVPGTVMIMQVLKDNVRSPHIVNLFGQYCPGKPGQYYNGLDGVDDSKMERLQYFKHALFYGLYEEVADIEGVTIAFPMKIGCGLAGGDWNEYIKIIEEFEQLLPNANIVIY